MAHKLLDKTRQENRRKRKAASMSIAANVSLTLVKIVVAALSGSIAILAEVLHSLFDLLASVFALLGIRQAAKPADDDHPFGHEKFENLSSLLQTLLIALTAIFVIYEAVNRILHPGHPLDSIPLALGVMGLTLVVDIIVSRYLHRVSSETGSVALEADAYHFSTDLWSAIAVIVGLLFVLAGFPVFDAIAAIIVAILMLWISYQLGMKSINVMLDQGPGRRVIKHLNQIIRSTRGVENYHHLRMRMSGSRLLGEVHLRMRGTMTVSESHELAHMVKHKVMERNPRIKDFTIHVEPASSDDIAMRKAKAAKRHSVKRR
jgi:cation diffusion facilitator family transporter